MERILSSVVERRGIRHAPLREQALRVVAEESLDVLDAFASTHAGRVGMGALVHPVLPFGYVIAGDKVDWRVRLLSLVHVVRPGDDSTLEAARPHALRQAQLAQHGHPVRGGVHPVDGLERAPQLLRRIPLHSRQSLGVRVRVFVVAAILEDSPEQKHRRRSAPGGHRQHVEARGLGGVSPHVLGEGQGHQHDAVLPGLDELTLRSADHRGTQHGDCVVDPAVAHEQRGKPYPRVGVIEIPLRHVRV
mmetsp:Transcript_1827/g.7381  ORF Transcript_1827/g.7381 Transcript_1827/m.7381 type:complete len:247 (-) Transcript_1827:275-1015(-)